MSHGPVRALDWFLAVFSGLAAPQSPRVDIEDEDDDERAKAGRTRHVRKQESLQEALAQHHHQFMQFDHEKLDVDHAELEFITWVSSLLSDIKFETTPTPGTVPREEPARYSG